MSGKSDTSTHQPKKKVYKKKKERIERRSKRSGEPDFEKIPFDPTSHYISPKIKFLTLFRYQEKILVNQTFVVPTPNFY